jgi:hypothetical protein
MRGGHAFEAPGRFDQRQLAGGLHRRCHRRSPPIQVARTFWDMDDWNNEAGAGAAAGDDDMQSYTSTSLFDRWDNFGRRNFRDFTTRRPG